MEANTDTTEAQRKYMHRRREIERIAGDYITCKEETFTSPSGRCVAKVASLASPDKQFWGYTLCTVYKAGERAPLATVLRNYDRFWLTWLEDHPNGNDYLLCEEDYQGYGFVNLTKGTQAFTHEGAGYGWCVAELTLHGPTLGVAIGCFWGGGYDYTVWDLRDPDTLPWPSALEPDEEGYQPELFSAEADKANAHPGTTLRVEGDTLTWAWGDRQIRTWTRAADGIFRGMVETLSDAERARQAQIHEARRLWHLQFAAVKEHPATQRALATGWGSLGTWKGTTLLLERKDTKLELAIPFGAEPAFLVSSRLQAAVQTADKTPQGIDQLTAYALAYPRTEAV